MKQAKHLLWALPLLAAALCNRTASAQEFPVVTSVEANYIGLGVGLVPDYVGSQDYTWGILPAFRYEFGDNRFIDVTGNYASANIIDNGTMRFGPALRYRFGRDHDVEDESVKLLPEIDGTTEAGVTFSGNWILNNNPRNRFVLGMDALWDVGDVSNGFSGTAYARYWAPVSRAFDLGIAGTVQFNDGKFNDTYFGVSPEGSADSGLPAFKASGGIGSFSIMPMAVMHLSENWHIGAGVRYMRLTADAADSPIVDERGSADQIIGGLGAVYSWGAKVHTK